MVLFFGFLKDANSSKRPISEEVKSPSQPSSQAPIFSPEAVTVTSSNYLYKSGGGAGIFYSPFCVFLLSGEKRYFKLVPIPASLLCAALSHLLLYAVLGLGDEASTAGCLGSVLGFPEPQKPPSACILGPVG